MGQDVLPDKATQSKKITQVKQPLCPTKMVNIYTMIGFFAAMLEKITQVEEKK